MILGWEELRKREKVVSEKEKNLEIASKSLKDVEVAGLIESRDPWGKDPKDPGRDQDR